MATLFLRTHQLPVTRLIGKRIRTSLAENRTVELWRNFMPRKNEIGNVVSKDLYSVEVYDAPIAMDQFTPGTKFDKWAAVAVSDYITVPLEFETLTVPPGVYAVFLFKGRSSAFAEAFHYIFQTWLPSSPYKLDNRPHFEVMGEKYKNDDPDSEEEIWIPITNK